MKYFDASSMLKSWNALLWRGKVPTEDGQTEEPSRSQLGPAIIALHRMRRGVGTILEKARLGRTPHQRATESRPITERLGDL